MSSTILQWARYTCLISAFWIFGPAPAFAAVFFHQYYFNEDDRLQTWVVVLDQSADGDWSLTNVIENVYIAHGHHGSSWFLSSKPYDGSPVVVSDAKGRSLATFDGSVLQIDRDRIAVRREEMQPEFNFRWDIFRIANGRLQAERPIFATVVWGAVHDSLDDTPAQAWMVRRLGDHFLVDSVSYQDIAGPYDSGRYLGEDLFAMYSTEGGRRGWEIVTDQGRVIDFVDRVEPFRDGRVATQCAGDWTLRDAAYADPLPAAEIRNQAFIGSGRHVAFRKERWWYLAELSSDTTRIIKTPENVPIHPMHRGSVIVKAATPHGVIVVIGGHMGLLGWNGEWLIHPDWHEISLIQDDLYALASSRYRFIFALEQNQMVFERVLED